MKGKRLLGSEQRGWLFLLLLSGGIASEALGQTEPGQTEPAQTQPAPTEALPTEPAQTETILREPETELRGSLAGERAAQALKRSLTNEVYNMHWGPVSLRTEAKLEG